LLPHSNAITNAAAGSDRTIGLGRSGGSGAFQSLSGGAFASIAKSTIACAMGSVEGSPPQTASARRYCPRDLRRHVVGKR
jgi:hypothetical protein